jgi:IclR family transcriptional regulator, KDG regulon repressor
VAWEPEDCSPALRRRLRPCTPSPLTEGGDFRRELLKIPATRYALDGEEFALGLKCIAAPLFDHSRRVVASIGIAGPAVRLSSDCLPRLASLVRESAAGVSRALGAGPAV